MGYPDNYDVVLKLSVPFRDMNDPDEPITLSEEDITLSEEDVKANVAVDILRAADKAGYVIILDEVSVVDPQPTLVKLGDIEKDIEEYIEEAQQSDEMPTGDSDVLRDFWHFISAKRARTW